MKPLLVLLSLFLCVQSCAQEQEVLLSPDQLKELMQNQSINLIDIRTPEEFMWGYIEGAININFYERQQFTEKLNLLDKSKPIVVYCAVGVRSRNSIKMVRNLGFTTVYDLEGGFNRWLKQGNNYIRN